MPLPHVSTVLWALYIYSFLLTPTLGGRYLLLLLIDKETEPGRVNCLLGSDLGSIVPESSKSLSYIASPERGNLASRELLLLFQIRF